jgi:hypothetical protein
MMDWLSPGPHTQTNKSEITFNNEKKSAILNANNTIMPLVRNYRRKIRQLTVKKRQQTKQAFSGC